MHLVCQCWSTHPLCSLVHVSSQRHFPGGAAAFQPRSGHVEVLFRCSFSLDQCRLKDAGKKIVIVLLFVYFAAL